MPTEEDICKRLDIVTGGLSTQFRALSAGVLAFSGGLLLWNPTTSNSLPSWLKNKLVWVALWIVVALLFDVVQLSFGYWVAYLKYKEITKKIKQLRTAGVTGEEIAGIEVEYDEDSWRYRTQMGFFYLKIGVLVSASGWLAHFMMFFLNQNPILGH